MRASGEDTGPRPIPVHPLLSKCTRSAREDSVQVELIAVDADYVGFQIGDEFVVGYGLDYMERYRNLPCIGVLRKDLIAPAG